jgi:hypothetical protein
MEDQGKEKGEKGHSQILEGDPNDESIEGMGEPPPLLEGDCDPHSEHYDPQHKGDLVSQGSKLLREKIAQSPSEHNPEGEKVLKKPAPASGQGTSKGKEKKGVVASQKSRDQFGDPGGEPAVTDHKESRRMIIKEGLDELGCREVDDLQRIGEGSHPFQEGGFEFFPDLFHGRNDRVDEFVIEGDAGKDSGESGLDP